MTKLFVALALPDLLAVPIRFIQVGIPGARWSTREQLHLTLRFIGEVDGSDMDAIDDALSVLAVPKFTLRLKGVGTFGGDRRRAVWAGVEHSEPLLHLQRKVEMAIQRAGMTPEARKSTPHVTLARLPGDTRGSVMDYLVDHALFASVPFEVGSFILYSSHSGRRGPVYREERTYNLK